MKIDVLTLFPDMYEGFLNESIIERAIEKKKVKINLNNLRDYTKNKHKKVDDTPYGGGAGMVLMCQPVFDAVKVLKKKNSKVILLTPAGELYNQKKAQELSKEEHLILIAGHYEGFDERIREIVDMEISIGDYILTGGELPSMVMIDSIVRLIPGVIEEKSLENESFNDDLLDYPVYTKPKNYKGMEVPDVLLSGHHENIEKWRQTQRIIKTMEKRPDLIKKRRKRYILIKEDKLKQAFLEYKKINGLDIIPRNNAKRDDVISITKMIIVKESFIEKILKLKIEKKFKYFIDKISNINDEEEDERSIQLFIDEIEIYRNSKLNYYLRFLGVEYKDLVLKKLQLILNELNIRKHLILDVKSSEIGKKNKINS